MGTMNSTPSQPPKSATGKIRQKVKSELKPRKMSAGMVNITPAARDSPADPVVCTILFSRIVERPKARKMLMESTEIGIEAEIILVGIIVGPVPLMAGDLDGYECTELVSSPTVVHARFSRG